MNDVLNIELWGNPNPASPEFNDGTRSFVKKICQLFETADYKDTVTVSVIAATVFNQSEENIHFLRIVGSEEAIEEHIGDMLRRLRSLEIEIQTVVSFHVINRKCHRVLLGDITGG